MAAARQLTRIKAGLSLL